MWVEVLQDSLVNALFSVLLDGSCYSLIMVEKSCVVGGPTAYELSRIKDALVALKGTPFHDPFWEALPHYVKFDYNWAKWKYVPTEEK